MIACVVVVELREPASLGVLCRHRRRLLAFRSDSPRHRCCEYRGTNNSGRRRRLCGHRRVAFSVVVVVVAVSSSTS